MTQNPPFKKIGHYTIIEDDVIYGPNCELGHFVILKKGTRMGSGVIMADGVKTTGKCWIGNNVNIRTGAIISKGTFIEDDVFIGPGVITNHTKHVLSAKGPGEDLVTIIRQGAIIGSGACVIAGVIIERGVVVGAGAVVTKNLYDPGIYVGNPARRIK